MAISKTKTLVSRATSLGGNPGEKQLPFPRFDKDGRIQVTIDGPAWNRDYRGIPRHDGSRAADTLNAYFGTDAVLNTKYVIDAKRHPVVGCVVELTSGRTVHYDVDLEQILIAGNRR